MASKSKKKKAAEPKFAVVTYRGERVRIFPIAEEGRAQRYLDERVKNDTERTQDWELELLVSLAE